MSIVVIWVLTSCGFAGGSEECIPSFYPEGGGDTFLHKAENVLQDYRTSQTTVLFRVKRRGFKSKVQNWEQMCVVYCTSYPTGLAFRGG
jgi:hypothetical protein